MSPMRLTAACILTSLLLLSISPGPAAGEPNAGVYVGVGPTESRSGTCHEAAAVVLYPSVLAPGLWAAEIDCAYGPLVNNPSLGVGLRSWPSHVANDLAGTPEIGFFASGTANVRGTSPGTVDWDLTIAPLGEATQWSLHTIFYPDHDYYGNGAGHGWWNGTADFVGAHV